MSSKDLTPESTGRDSYLEIGDRLSAAGASSPESRDRSLRHGDSSSLPADSPPDARNSSCPACRVLMPLTDDLIDSGSSSRAAADSALIRANEAGEP